MTFIYIYIDRYVIICQYVHLDKNPPMNLKVEHFTPSKFKILTHLPHLSTDRTCKVK